MLCGNEKLLKRQNVDLKYNDFHNNMQQMEREGNTVVCLAVENEPRLLISMNEKHVTKPEALPVVNYLRDVMGMRVAMITGDNEHVALKVARYLDIPD